MISDTKFLSQLKLVKGAIKTPKSFAHKYFIFSFKLQYILAKKNISFIIMQDLNDLKTALL